MIHTVTPNPALDLTVRIGVLEVGQTHRTAPATARLGGKGLNVAAVAAALGHPTSVTLTAHADTGARLSDEFGEATSTLVPIGGALRHSWALVEDDGRTTVINEAGPPQTVAEWAALVDAAGRNAAAASVTAISGSMPPETDQERVRALVAACRDAGRPVIADTSGPALQWSVEAGADWIKPNHLELADLTGLTDPREGLAALRERGARGLVVSLGEDGLLFSARPGQVVHARLARPLRGNPTGAGDAAVAALAYCLATDVSDPADIARLMVAVSADAVLAPVAGEVSGNWQKICDEVLVNEESK